MSTVTVTIAGRSYRIACGDGEEGHIEVLAGFVDSQIEDMRGAFGEIGDMRLHVMATLSITDKLGEAERKIADLEEEREKLHQTIAGQTIRLETLEARTADAVAHAAGRIERVARSLHLASADH